MATLNDEELNKLWRRAGGRCECTLQCATHKGYRCNVPLASGKWHIHHVVSQAAGGADTSANTQALCIPCHENTRSYGRNLTR